MNNEVNCKFKPGNINSDIERHLDKKYLKRIENYERNYVLII